MLSQKKVLAKLVIKVKKREVESARDNKNRIKGNYL